jgi:multiple sugar transport system permease protein
VVFSRRRNRHLQENLTAYAFLLPQIVVFLVFLVYPVVEGFRLSLYEVTYTRAFFAGLDNYRRLLADGVFWKATANTLSMVLWTTVFTVIPAFFIAASVFEKSPRYVTFIRGFYYIPTIISMAVYAMIWKWLANPTYGALTYILQTLGAGNVNLLGASMVLPLMIALVSLMNLGQAIILYIAAMQGVDHSLFEAARIDGAGRAQTVRHVLAPMVWPTTVYLVIMNVIGVMKVFVIINVMTAGGPNHASTVLMYLCYIEAFKNNRIGQASAIGVMMFVATFAISIIPLRRFIGGKER